MFFSTVISTPMFSPVLSSNAWAGGPAEFLLGDLGSSLLYGPRALILTFLVFAVLTCTRSAYLLSASPNTSNPAPRLAVEQYASTVTALLGIIGRLSSLRLGSSFDNNWFRPMPLIQPTGRRPESPVISPNRGSGPASKLLQESFGDRPRSGKSRHSI